MQEPFMSHPKRNRIRLGKARLGAVQCQGVTLAAAAEYVGSYFAAEGAGAAAVTAGAEAGVVEVGGAAALEAGGVSAAGAAGASGGFGGGLLASAAEGAAGAAAAAALAPKPMAPPKPKSVIPMPDAQAMDAARKRSIAEAQARKGRASTILTSDKLGG
jgi:hypothetical protein